MKIRVATYHTFFSFLIFISAVVYRPAVAQVSLSTNAIASPLCAGSSISISYTMLGTPVAGNVFTAQLSNSVGSFTNPTNIGFLNGVVANPINAIIPLTTPAGTGYRIRVVSSNPTPTSALNNGTNLVINSAVFPKLSIASSVNSQNLCSNTSVTFTATPTNGGATPVYQWKVNGVNVGTNSTTFTRATWANGDVVECTMLSNATCAFPGTIWSNQIVVTLQNNVANTWQQKADFQFYRPDGPTPRTGAVAFSIGDKAYVGTGTDLTGRKNDFWEFDPVSGVWTQKANFAGVAREEATGFSIGTKGYVGTGFDGTSRLSDFWEYNPVTNVWTARAAFGGGVRSDATGFSIANKGYLGTGYDGTARRNDFYEYDPNTNVWILRATFPGTARSGAVSFCIDDLGYLGTGFDATGINRNDFWQFNPASNAWTQMANFGGTARTDAVGFSVSNKGYIGAGFDLARLADFYEYNPATNTWVSITAYPGDPRTGAVGFSIGSKGYVGTGRDATLYKNDFWEYDPAAASWTSVNDYGGPNRLSPAAFSIGGEGYLSTGVYGSGYTQETWSYNPVTNVWTQKANFPGTARASAVGFSIGSRGYVGTGSNATSDFNDFWEYNPIANAWTQKANFGGTARDLAVGFSIGDKGYIGTGQDAVGNKNDFWEYDPVPNTWTQKANFGGTARRQAVGFGIGGKGYIGTGNDGVLRSDFWEYYPVTNSWTLKTSFGGAARAAATGFSIGNKGYIGTGSIAAGNAIDFWEYDTLLNTWTQKANFGGLARFAATGMSIGPKGYIGLGTIGGSLGRLNDFWEYDPANNSIQTGVVSTGPYCVGQTITIPFTTNCNAFNAGNIFTAQLSDSTGDFSSPTNLLIVSSTTTQITATIPSGVSTGTDYQIRVLASNPSTTGSPSTSFLTIYDTIRATLTSAASTVNQSKCINTAITSIVYNTLGVTGVAFSGLPAGVFGIFTGDKITINGTPTVSGTFNFSAACTGPCGSVTVSGTIIVVANKTILLTSAASTSTQSICINTPITNINYSTSGATGALFSGLPTGVTGSFLSNIVTISGTPTVAGIFNYTVTMTGGCGTAIATGSITISPNNTITLTSAASTTTQSLCANSAIANITYSTTGATGALFSGLPTGVNGAFLANTVTISGTPTASGTFIYTVTLTGGCGNITATGSIVVTANKSVTLSSAAGTNAQTVCINTPITNITYATIGATGINYSGLPAGVSGTFSGNTGMISGTPTATGTFVYSLVLVGTCGSASTTGAITVTPNSTITLTSAAATANQTLCVNTPITNITYTTVGASTVNFSGLPAGVTGSFAANTATISGTPIETGTYNYTVTNVGCGSSTATGSIVVNGSSPTVTISSNVPTAFICPGTSVSFTAVATNAGATPVYQWFKNGVAVGTNSTTYSNASWSNFDSVECKMVSSASCMFLTTAYSNRIKILFENTVANSWQRVADLGSSEIGGAEARKGAVSFSIGAKGYIATGDETLRQKNDLWEYDPVSNFWTQRASLPGLPRRDAVAFTIGTKGYLGTGRNNINGDLADFWEYDPVSNSWIAKANFPGGVRFAAFGISICGKGYIGLGINAAIGLVDFWEYNPTINTWISKAPFPGTERAWASGFSIGSKGYVGTGFTSSGSALSDFWEYNPSTDSWLQKSSFTGNPRYKAVGVSAGNVGFIGTGFIAPTSYTKDFWKYTPSTDSWSRIADMQGFGRECATAFSVNGKFYVGSGDTLDDYLNDFWEYNPATNTWAAESDLGSSGRIDNAIGFATDQFGFVGFGRSETISGSYVIQESSFWKFDPNNNKWTPQSNIGIGIRMNAVAFSINQTGYVGLGSRFTGNTNTSDFWSFNSGTNSWTQISSYPGSVRTGAIAFSIGSKGYVGIGSGATPNEFYAYDSSSNTWSACANFPGTSRVDALGFSLLGKGYVCVGTNGATSLNDFWEYDPIQNSWLRKADLLGVGGRSGMVAFTVGHKAYIGTGTYMSSASVNPFYEYDALTDAWTPATNYIAESESLLPTLQMVQFAVAFSVNGKGYVGTGRDYPPGVTNYQRNEFWEYAPSGKSIKTGSISTGPYCAGTAIAIPYTIGCSGFNADNIFSVELSDSAGSFSNPVVIGQLSATGAGTINCVIPTLTVASTRYKYRVVGSSPYTVGSISVGAIQVLVSYQPDVYIQSNIPTANLCSNTSVTFTATAIDAGASPVYQWRKNFVNVGTNSPTYTNSFWNYGDNVECSVTTANACSSPATAWSNIIYVDAEFSAPNPLRKKDLGFSQPISPESRFAPVTFTIGRKGYVGTGQSGATELSDFWEYDPTTNIWTQRANFSGRHGAVGFAIGGKGYVGMGINGAFLLNDFWEYDPATNAWTPKLSLPTARGLAVGFAIENKGYVGLGYTTGTYLNDFWEYNPSNNSWTMRTFFPAAARIGAIGFGLQGKGYVGTGLSIGSVYMNDIWEFNPQTNTWLQKANMSTTPREFATSFTVGNRAYAGSGYTAAATRLTDFWMYNPATNSWVTKASLPGSGVVAVFGFSVNTKGYIATTSQPSTITDFYEYDTATDGWSKKYNFGGAARQSAVGFSIRNKGYVTTGSNGNVVLKDLWEFDPDLNVWTQKADFGGVARKEACGFSIGNKGYVGTGTTGSVELQDFWEYNPATNMWTQKADFAGGLRQNAVGISIGNRGYIGTGSRQFFNRYNDWWEYNPDADTWIQKADMGGVARIGATAFDIGNKGYIVCGYDGTNYLNDCWEYNPVTNTWIQKTNFSGAARFEASGFGIGSKGYLMCGRGSASYGDLYMFDPSTNSWTNTTSFFSARSSGTGFSIGNRGYYGTGYTGAKELSDWWEYRPNEVKIKTGAVTGSFCAGSSLNVPFQTSCTGPNAANVFSVQLSDSAGTFANPVDIGNTLNTLTGQVTSGTINAYIPLNTPAGFRYRIRVVGSAPEAIGTDNGSDITILSASTPSIQIQSASTTVQICSPNFNQFNASITNGGSSPIYQWKKNGVVVGFNSSNFSNSIWQAGDYIECTLVSNATCAMPPTVTSNRIYIDLDSIRGWQQKPALGFSDPHYRNSPYIGNGSHRTGAISFTIGEKAYMGLGSNGSVNFNDIWTYDPINNTWSQCADYLGGYVTGATSFSIGSKGYVMGGNAGSAFYQNSLFEYNSTTNTWSMKTNLPASPRSGAFSFVIGGIAYVGGGFNGTSWLPDFWQYSPSLNSWLSRGTFTGLDREGAVGFSIGNKGYVAAGSNGVKKNDFWEFNPYNDVWIRKADLPTTARDYAVGFVLNGKGYVGTGNTSSSYSNEFWAYDASNNQWNSVAPMPGPGREKAFSFTTQGKGYVGNGFNGILLNDFWSYDPVTDAWSLKSNDGALPRKEAVGFSIGNKGYIGTGLNIFNQGLNDFWEFDYTTNSWSQKADFAGAGRNSAVGFSIGYRGYIGTGYTGTTYMNDFWEYNPLLNLWTQKTSLPGVARANAVGFGIGNKGYLGTGTNGSVNQNDFWEYDPTTNAWTAKANFAGTARNGAVGFSILDKGYLGTGFSTTHLNDFWEYNPATNAWTSKSNFPGSARMDAVGFAFQSSAISGSLGVIGTGADNTGVLTSDFYTYNPTVNIWNALTVTNPANLSRMGGVGFSIGSRGFVGTGNSFPVRNDFWELNMFNARVKTGNATPGAVCAGATIQVPFTTSCNFNNSSQFFAELSDSVGSFSNPTTIGSGFFNFSNTITATIPTNTPEGNHYKIRVSVGGAFNTVGFESPDFLTITPANTILLNSAVGTNAQTKCINTAITNITYATTGATGANVTGLPAGVTSNFASNTVTISGTPTVNGTFNYTVTLIGGCGTVTATGSLVVNPNNTILMSSAVGTNAQTICINTGLTNISYTTTSATGANVTGLPAGVTSNFASNTVTISGIPTVSGVFNYTVTLTGGCGTITANGSISVTASNTILLSSAVGTNAQTKCINTAITNITYTTTGATGAIVTGLPAGVTGVFAANTVTISGTPTVSGTFNYTVNLSGGCVASIATGSITVTPNNTILLSSAVGTNAQTKCINTAITNIIYTTTGATGVNVTGLPAGVISTFVSNTVTISGTPTASGTFNYTVTLTGGCGAITANGSLTVNPANSITVQPASTGQNICQNSTATALTVTAGGTGLSYQWFVNTVPSNTGGTTISGATSASFIPPSTSVGTAYYYVIVSGSCGSSVTSAISGAQIVKPNGTWLGNNSNWHDAGNWCGGVPVQTSNCVVPSASLNMPLVSSSLAFVNNLDIQSSSLVKVIGQTLKMSGTLSGTGFLQADSGTLELNGVVAQSISGSRLLNKKVGTFIISNNQGVTLSGTNDTLKVRQLLRFGASNCNLTTNGNLLIMSDSLGTASVGDMTSDGTNTGVFSGNRITGNVTVERFIPNHIKAWQFLGIPTVGQTIKESWMENNVPLGNIRPGYGGLITSNLGGNNAAAQTLGFDLYSPNGPSMKYFNPSNGTWTGVNSANDLISNTQGYMVFIRGDRSVTSFSQPATSTILRTTGQLKTSLSNPPSVINVPASSFASVGNPYASAIDYSRVLRTGGVQDLFYVWDPLLSPGYGYGAYQTFIRSGGSYLVVPGGGSYINGNTRIESGAAFFVRANSTGSGTVTFNESSKVSGSNMVTREPVEEKSRLFVRLYAELNGSLLDGVLTEMDSTYSDSPDELDAWKASATTGEQIALQRDSVLLSVDRMQLPQVGDTIHYWMGHLRRQNYQLRWMPEMMATFGLQPILVDKYLMTEQLISLEDTTLTNFTVNSDLASAQPDRFFVVFRPLTPVSMSIIDIGAVRNRDMTVNVTWNVAIEEGVSIYEIERSTDGLNFNSIGIQLPLNNNGSRVNFIFRDSTALSCSLFYRIRVLETDGTISFSDVARVGEVQKEGIVSVNPNPIRGRKINLEMRDVKNGKYQFVLIDATGKKILLEESTIIGSYNRLVFNIGQTSSGVLLLNVIDPGNQKKVFKIVLTD